jgi:hypothetical protein
MVLSLAFGGAFTLAGEERRLWRLAGAKGLSSLTTPLLCGELSASLFGRPLSFFGRECNL